MTYEEAAAAIRPGRYRHFKGKEYEAIGIARHSETEEPMVVYRALYGERGLWVRPAAMWCEEVVRDGKTARRFTRVGQTMAFDPKKEQKEREYADEIPDEEDGEDNPYEPAYRDGSARHECWPEGEA